MVLQSTSPFHITSVSSNWCEASGFMEEAVVGRSLQFLEGPSTDRQAILRLLGGNHFCETVVLYRLGCKPWLTCLGATPVYEGQVARTFVQVSQ
jgi:hypothetical protein